MYVVTEYPRIYLFWGVALKWQGILRLSHHKFLMIEAAHSTNDVMCRTICYDVIYPFFPYQFLIFKYVGGWKPSMQQLKNLNSYINKRILVSTTFLWSQKSLTFNLTSGPTDFLCCLMRQSLFPVVEVADFFSRKGAKRRRISHQMVNCLSHCVEVQYKRWNHCKVQVLNKHVFQAPF